MLDMHKSGQIKHLHSCFKDQITTALRTCVQHEYLKVHYSTCSNGSISVYLSQGPKKVETKERKEMEKVIEKANYTFMSGKL